MVIETTKTKKAFREKLNREDAAIRATKSDFMHVHGRFQQRKRLYGDYLWHQDRERFNAEYADWSK